MILRMLSKPCILRETQPRDGRLSQRELGLPSAGLQQCEAMLHANLATPGAQPA